MNKKNDILFFRHHSLGITHVYLVRLVYSLTVLAATLFYIYATGNFTKLSARALSLALNASCIAAILSTFVAIPALTLSIIKKVRGAVFPNKVFILLLVSLSINIIIFVISSFITVIMDGLTI